MHVRPQFASVETRPFDASLFNLSAINLQQEFTQKLRILAYLFFFAGSTVDVIAIHAIVGPNLINA